MLAELHPRLPSVVDRASGWIGRQKKALNGIACAAVVAIAAVFAFARIESEAPLFDVSLKSAQALEVENALTLWGEPYRTTPAGDQILVPAARRRDLLLRLTIAGLPRRYIPTSVDVLQDQVNALTPQSVVDDRRRSGIEGDLVAGLRRIAGVADATVVLPPAENDFFADDSMRSPPSAAVQLVMQSGDQLSTDAIAGIRKFVAAAYPGLSPDHVTVVDGSGAAQGTAAPPDRAVSKESRVQQAVQSALDAVLGQGTAVVRVSVRTNGAEQQTQSTRVIPRGDISADIGREHARESGKNFDKERSIRRFAYDTISERRTTSADAESRISIAVFLDEKKVDEVRRAALGALVRAAAGADLRSGDEVVVETLPFANPKPVDRALPSPPPSPVKALVPAAVACAIALFGFASIPRVHDRRPLLAAQPARRAGPDERDDSAAVAAMTALAGESPQAAAYAIDHMPHNLQGRVLAVCAADRRAAIEEFLHRRRVG